MLPLTHPQFQTTQKSEDGALAAPHAPTPDDNAFHSAQQAAGYATEMLRLRQFPKIARCYNDEAPPAIVAAGGEPAGDTAYATALSVYQCIYRLPDDAREILQLHLWGDYVTPARFRAASTMQEKWRREGKRVRLSHRYSQRQLASILNLSKSTAARRLAKAYQRLETELQSAGLVVAILPQKP